jgi:cytochrome P450
MPETHQVPRDAIAAVSHPDPWPWYAQLRRERPFFFDEELKLWVASDAASAIGALEHPQLRVRPPGEPVPKALVGRDTGGVFARLLRMNDGDFHREHRPRVAASARRWSEEAIATAASQAARDLRDALPVNDLLTALPARAMARLIGVAEDALDATTDQVLAFVRGIGPGADEAALERSDAAARELMAQGEREGLDPVAAANRIALMQQSVDATAALLGNTVLSIRRFPQLWNAQDAVPFVAECSRWDPGVHNTRRFAAQDLTLRGERVEAGQGVLVVLASANRDPSLNAAPDDFDIHRANRRSLGFGAGAHACPGESLAIRIVASALPELLDESESTSHFGEHAGFLPLPNARLPAFETFEQRIEQYNAWAAGREPYSQRVRRWRQGY